MGILRSRQESCGLFGRLDFEIAVAVEILDLGENLDETLRSCQDFSETLGEFLAAEILRSRQDLGEISPRSWQSRQQKTRQDARRDLSLTFTGEMA